MKKIKFYLLSAIILFIFFPNFGSAKVMYKIALKDGYNYQYFYPQKHADILFGEFEKYYWNGKEIILNDDEIEELISLGGKVEKRVVKGINRGFLKKYIQNKVVPNVNIDGTGAVLTWTGEGKVKISNNAMVDKKLDVDLTVYLLERALKQGVEELVLPIDEVEPDLQFSENLKDLGINGIISTAQSDFSGSTPSRIVNIDNSISKFNGIIIQPGEVFSFNDNLGPVNKRTGFVKSLVIQGANLVAGFGGGVCQVSTTLYRTVMNSGLPIEARRNHSFSVSHYNPQGSDATIYLGGQDFRFENNYDFPIILQGSTKGDLVYFVIYGDSSKVKDVKLFGPYFSNYTNVPSRIRASSNLAFGEKRIRERGQPGFVTHWFRVVNENIEQIVSKYVSRPTIWEVGGLNI